MKRHKEEMRKIRKGMEEDHDKWTKEAVEQARSKILNNGSTGGTNDAVPDFSMSSSMSE